METFFGIEIFPSEDLWSTVSMRHHLFWSVIYCRRWINHRSHFTSAWHARITSCHLSRGSFICAAHSYGLFHHFYEGNSLIKTRGVAIQSTLHSLIYLIQDIFWWLKHEGVSWQEWHSNDIWQLRAAEVPAHFSRHTHSVQELRQGLDFSWFWSLIWHWFKR